MARPPFLRFLPLLAALAMAACSPRPDKGPVVVSAIGSAPGYVDLNHRSADMPDRMLIDATAQGLVRFDAAGQVEPGLAERWIVIDDGRTYIFRLREAAWANGDPVTASDVALILRRAIGPDSRNPLKPFLTAIDEIKPMTERVVEVSLTRPRPDLLKLFAQPDLAILRANPPGGSGPFRIVRDGDPVGRLLRPVADLDRSPDDDIAAPAPEQDVRLIGEGASRAIVRFVGKQSDYVAGGTLADWPLVTRAGTAPNNIKLDATAGLFGLAIVDRQGFLIDPAGRGAIAAAIDRTALIAAIAPDWGQPVERLLPDKLDAAAAPAAPAWANGTADARLAAARQQVATYRAQHPEPIVLRISLPTGPGATLLYGQLAARLILIGIVPQRVGMSDAADLRLVDAVAPYDSARWYLATACQPCSEQATAALEAARDAPDMAQRATHITEADRLLADDVAFIPIATPFRWSLVSLRLKQWQGNARGWHPLNHLRNDTN
ncbi:MAG: ABC transporter substrate-binding protein [Sphingomonas sp.]|uniref:ABC transporter substrate-binding protein n=1 Tax=Sphingomonas sp. TaxID=28214 RepID=UPI001AC8E40D|nr:ABC transporter substrate-binding protein [Sphingomonas sp.]MBN8807085.1 ABC transporter substrate-binding protein [Sphingomonas sp.]